MKKLYLLLFVIQSGIIIPLSAGAQGIHQFWGVTRFGGESDQGILFSTRFDGAGLKTRNTFKVITPNAGNGGAYSFVSFNNKLYGFFSFTGWYDEGILMEFDPATGKYTQKLDLYKMGMSSNDGFMYQYNNKLYGFAVHDGEHKVYEYDPVTNAVSFKKAIGYGFKHLAWYNNRFYGVTNYDGAFNNGMVFSYDPVTYTVTKLIDVPAGIGGLKGMHLYNNKFYSIAWEINGITEFNPANNQLVQKAALADAGGYSSNSDLMLFNGKMYGTTESGGASDIGVLFEFNPALGTITKKLDLTASNVMRGFTAIFNNKLYGTMANGGANDNGKIFEYDPATNQYATRAYFSEAIGTNPASPMLLVNNRMYGFAMNGGAVSGGTLFEYNPVANGLTVKVTMGESNGHAPYGKMVYYAGKLYGFTSEGGKNNQGVIYSYDLATHTYALRYHMYDVGGYGVFNGSLVLYNNRLYGVMQTGGPAGGGILFEFNPATDLVTVKHNFEQATGEKPVGRPVLYNSKFYGTTLEGGNTNTGVLYEYDLATSTYSVKVHFSNTFGTRPYAPLTVYNAKLYGTCSAGGVANAGTLFEYNPAIGGFSVRYNFVENLNANPRAGMVVLNDKLYGTTDEGPVGAAGTLFEFNPATGIITNKHNFTFPEGSLPRNEVHVYNNKLYGLAAAGGGVVTYGGVLYEFDLALNKWTAKSVFGGENGRYPYYSAMTVVPALVAPGTPGTCAAANAALINTTNANTWVPFTDAEGNAVMEINANGNILGSVRVEFYTHDGETRIDQANRFYLDRNITVTVENQPATPVSIRLYIKKTEFDKLKNTAGSGVVNVNDITLFKNGDPCSDKVSSLATPIGSSVTTWGLDYVYTAQVSSFSSFYFASKTYTALPVKLEYFKGNAEVQLNRLHWKASCTENTDFIIERSANGHQFNSIGVVKATAEDCGNPFMFPDQQPLNGKNFYRLQMKEQSGAVTYSSIISIDRSASSMLQISLSNNPVLGSRASFMVQSPEQQLIAVMVYDATGRMMMHTQWRVSKGAQSMQLDLPQLPKGVYTVVFMAKEKLSPVRFVKQ